MDDYNYETRLKTNIRNFVREPNNSVDYSNFKYCVTPSELNACNKDEFVENKTFAENLTDSVLMQAVERVNAVLDNQSRDLEYIYETIDDNSYQWPSIEQFQLETDKMIELIKNYVATWQIYPKLKFFVRFSYTKYTSINTSHKLDVLFSCPTKDCPNPQAVCYVSFTIEVCSVIPKTAPIFVTYQFQGYNQIFKADKRTKFQNQYIKNILLSKTNLYNKLTL